MRSTLGGLLAAGLLSVGCGGMMPEEQPEQSLPRAEQELTPSCPAGYTLGAYWDCAQICGAGWGNFVRYYCTNGADYYEAGTGSHSCGDCY
ncbi:hypothetical protein [Archangium lipolyticum]|uniref:hypothetical protein n=1 Tax=Archangium lipolyticum TaxID=2970465 RepID=UPI00214A87AB|nr:hypothetical protein [Archangium lipolyticum]